jgi:hypothetical protein
MQSRQLADTDAEKRPTLGTALPDVTGDEFSLGGLS